MAYLSMHKNKSLEAKKTIYCLRRNKNSLKKQNDSVIFKTLSKVIFEEKQRFKLLSIFVIQE
jgi:hypothetical protein